MTKELPKYTLIEIPGGVYILHTQAPYYIGRVWKYKSHVDLNAQIKKLNPLAYCFIDDHCMAVTIWTILGGRIILSPEAGILAERITREMADWYKVNTVDKNPRFYNKFK